MLLQNTLRKRAPSEELPELKYKHLKPRLVLNAYTSIP